MNESCPRCGSKMHLDDLSRTDILPTGELITTYWACEACRKRHTMNIDKIPESERGWAWVFSEDKYYRWYDLRWREYSGKIRPEKVVFT